MCQFVLLAVAGRFGVVSKKTQGRVGAPVRTNPALYCKKSSEAIAISFRGDNAGDTRLVGRGLHSSR